MDKQYSQALQIAVRQMIQSGVKLSDIRAYVKNYGLCTAAEKMRILKQLHMEKMEDRT